MKNLLLLLFAVAFTFTSCEDDLISDERSSNEADSGIETRDKNGKNALQQVVKVSNWLAFKSENHYRQVYDYLESVRINPANNKIQRILRDDEGKGYGTTYDPYPMIHDIELSLGINSLRKDILLQEDRLLRDGEDVSALNSIIDKDLRGTSTQTLYNSDFVIQIGDKILKRESSSLIVAVNDNNIELMNSIINNGTHVIYEEGNVEYVDLELRKPNGPRDDFPCTANFDVLSGGFEDPTGLSATKSFIWNNGDASGAKDLTLTWNFGDGTTTTSTSPTMSHKYENLQAGPATNSFNVCVDVSYKIIKEDEIEQCLQSFCQQVNITLDEVEEEEPDLCDELTYAITIGGALDDEFWLTANPRPGNAIVVDVAASDFLMSLISATTESSFGITWSIGDNQTSGTTTSFTAGCDGDYQITLTILINPGTENEQICASHTTTYYHDVDANCSPNKDIPKGWTNEFYTSAGSTFKLRWRAKHETNGDDGWWWFHGEPNQVEGEFINYKKDGNKWKEAKLGSTIIFEGNVYPKGDACDCGGIAHFMDPAVNGTRSSNGVHVKRWERNYAVFDKDKNGIFCKADDPYTVTFEVDWLGGDPFFSHTVAFPNF